MNTSGRAVRDVIDHFRIIPKRCIVIYDDMDLEFGTIRIRNSGSAGGEQKSKTTT
jgi:PTH1 family peptidyl-tRNA hydrolase